MTDLDLEMDAGVVVATALTLLAIMKCTRAGNQPIQREILTIDTKRFHLHHDVTTRRGRCAD